MVAAVAPRRQPSTRGSWAVWLIPVGFTLLTLIPIISVRCG